MKLAFDALTLFGLLGMSFSLASFVMKSMLPLRVLAVGANIAFIGFAVAMFFHPGTDPKAPIPGLVLNALLLPINLRRIWEIRKLTDEISRATVTSPVSEWLLPHMQRRRFRAGEIILRQGERADTLIYIAAGTLTLVEIDVAVGPGALLGEIGLFSPEHVRTQTLRADTDGELYEMTEEALFQLHYQNPTLGFYMIRLVAERLMKDLERQREKLGLAPA